MRARAKGSLFTTWTGGEGSETGAGAENGDCNAVGGPSGGAPTGAGRSLDEPAGQQVAGGSSWVTGGIRVQGSQGGKSGGLRQPRVQGRRSSLRGGLVQANMNGPGGFERAVSEAGAVSCSWRGRPNERVRGRSRMRPTGGRQGNPW